MRLIPAGKEEDGQALGYIVPVVGMCSHISAPPPNEMVFESARGIQFVR